MSWDLVEGDISNRMTIPRLKGIRTDVGVGIRRGAGAVIGEARELTAVDQPEVILDDGLASSGVGTKPGPVSGRAARDTLKVSIGPPGVGLSVGSGGVELCSSGGRAADEDGPLVVYVGDGEVTGELDLSDILNGGVEALGGAVSIDVGEQVRWLDGVVSSPGLSEVVCSGD